MVFVVDGEMRSHIVNEVVWIDVNERAEQNPKLRSVQGGGSVIENPIERFCPMLQQSSAFCPFLLISRCLASASESIGIILRGW